MIFHIYLRCDPRSSEVFYVLRIALRGTLCFKLQKERGHREMTGARKVCALLADQRGACNASNLRLSRHNLNAKGQRCKTADMCCAVSKSKSVDNKSFARFAEVWTHSEKRSQRTRDC